MLRWLASVGRQLSESSDPPRRDPYLYAQLRTGEQQQNESSSSAAVASDIHEGQPHDEEGREVANVSHPLLLRPSSSSLASPEDGLDNRPARNVVERSRQLWSHLSLSEISGSFGDLGTFIPLFVAMGRGDHRSIHVAPALFFAGLSNVVTGYVWDLPLPVQPMKTICAVALIGELDQVQVSTAGVWMGLVLLILGVTNAIEVVNLLVPRSVVSGLQMGVGTSLAVRGLDLIAPLPWWVLDGRSTAVLSAILAMYLMNESRRESRGLWCPLPVGIVLFGLCTIIAVIQILGGDTGFSWQVAPIVESSLLGATWNDWMTGLWEGAVPQLPLSTLNTVISTCCLAEALYPGKDNLPTRRHMAISVGLMNLLLCPFGAMPSCHGAGGLAGQHKFGARHGTSVVFLGIVKVALAVACGGSILLFLDQIPSGVLGVMLVISGHSLALTGWTMLLQETPGEKLPQEAGVALLTMISIVGLKKTHYGAAVGLLAHIVYGDGYGLLRRASDPPPTRPSSA